MYVVKQLNWTELVTNLAKRNPDVTRCQGSEQTLKQQSSYKIVWTSFCCG